MRLLLGVVLVFALSACGGDGEQATTAGSSSVQPSASPDASLDTALADAAERLASSLPDDGSDAPSDQPSLPSMPSREADLTITADPDDYRVEGEPTACDRIWREGARLPSPYDGCSDGDLLVPAEGRRGEGGISFAYDGLCAGAGERIRRC